MSATMVSPAQHRNEAVAQAHLELLSNTALLKKMMDSEISNWQQQQQLHQKILSSEKQKESTVEAVTPPRVEIYPSPKLTGLGGSFSSNGKDVVGTVITGAQCEIHKPVAEKFSSVQASTVSPIADNRPVFVPPTTSYASLLLPRVPAFSTAAASAVTTLSHHQLQALALAHHHLPQNVKAAMAMMAHHHHHRSENHHATMASVGGGTIYGGPSSAFQKPFQVAVIQENAPPPTGGGGAAAAKSPMVSRETSPTTQTPGENPTREGPPPPSFEALLQENRRLQSELKQKDETIVSLQAKADGLEKQIFELRQLPTGKISHIPIEDMIRIMQEYGSEISNQTLPKRKQPVQKASIVRQFRRWNPEFFRFFVHVNGEWVPRLGREGELKRRAEKRRTAHKIKRADSPDSDASH